VSLAPPPISRIRPTPLQQGMLFDSILAGHRGAHIVQIVVRSAVPFDLLRLERAWAEVIARHELLRASFAWEGLDEPQLLVHSAGHVRIERASGDVTLAPEARISAFLSGDRERGVDLSRSPTMRLVVIDLRSSEPGAHAEALIWTFHHALLDGRSFGLVLREVFARYDGNEIDRRPPPAFRDHAEAVRALDRTAARTYWEGVLRGATRTPLALTRTPSKPGPHREVHARVPRDVVAALEAAGKGEGWSVNTFLHAAWALVLARHNRTEDVVFAATRAGRHTIERADVAIGCLITTVPVRVQVDPTSSARTLVERVRRAHLEVRPFEHSAAADVQRWSRAGTAPLGATHVVFERYVLSDSLRAEGGAWATREVSVHEQGSFPITLAAYQDDDGLRISLEHDTSALDEEVARGTLRQLAHVLASFAADLDVPIEQHALMDPLEASALIESAQPPSAIGRVRLATIPAAFAASLAAGPDRTALIDGPRQLSYRQLDACANRFARVLLDRGVSRGEVVALRMSRSAEWAVMMLAVAKTGAAFVPIDPMLPPEVQAHVLRDAGVRVVIRGPDDGPLGLDSDEDPGEPDVAITPHDLAYVLYTSGTTGKPKGVAVEHAALLAHDHAIARELALTPDDRCLQFTSIAFDVSLEEVFATWLAGGTVVLRSPEMATSVDAFLDGLALHAITVANVPTGFFHELVHRMTQRPARLPACVRLVVVGGEKASASDLVAFRALHPEVRWINAYGPTEATITATVFDGARFEPTRLDSVPIGRPLANTRAYVLDPQRRALPVGCPGELFLGGASLARGYVGLPEMTASRFVPDPFAGSRGARMYATGDLARLLPSGDLEFLGRTDSQVKIRGFRIELEGIAATLLAHPSVRRAVCVIRQGPTGDPRLLAYYVPRETDARLASELGGWLRSQLPPHAVPSALIEVASFPETTHGKIDVAALPDEAVEPEGPAKRRAPVTPLERALVAVWSSVLGRASVSIDDDFFDLGGDSLRAIRLVDEIASHLGQRVELAELLGARTIGELAARLERRDGSARPALRCLVPIQTGGARAPIFGVHVLGPALSYYRPLAKHLGPDQPVYGVTYPFESGDDPPKRVEDVARIYLHELRTVQPAGPYVLAAVSLAGVVAFEMGRQLAADGSDVTLLFFDVYPPEGMDSVGLAQRVKKHLAQLAEAGPGYVATRAVQRVEELATRARWRAIRTWRKLGGDIPPAQRIFAAVSENIELAQTYDARPASLRIVQFRATENVFYSEAFARAGLGWRERALLGLDLIDVPGEHLTMLAEPHVATLAARIREKIGLS
jgi:amino acid adenylation domain-containing protein